MIMILYIGGYIGSYSNSYDVFWDVTFVYIEAENAICPWVNWAVFLSVSHIRFCGQAGS